MIREQESRLHLQAAAQQDHHWRLLATGLAIVVISLPVDLTTPDQYAPEDALLLLQLVAITSGPQRR